MILFKSPACKLDFVTRGIFHVPRRATSWCCRFIIFWEMYRFFYLSLSFIYIHTKWWMNGGRELFLSSGNLLLFCFSSKKDSEIPCDHLSWLNSIVSRQLNLIFPLLSLWISANYLLNDDINDDDQSTAQRWLLVHLHFTHQSASSVIGSYNSHSSWNLSSTYTQEHKYVEKCISIRSGSTNTRYI